MTRASRRHRLLLIALPVLVGLAGAVAAAQYPSTEVHGSAQTGPHPFPHRPPVVLDFRPSAAWGPHRRGVVLTLRPRRPCTVHVSAVTSTQPGRIEVHAVEVGRRCFGRRRLEHMALPLPTLPEPRGNVRIDIGPETLRLRWAKPLPHPPGSIDI